MVLDLSRDLEIFGSYRGGAAAMQILYILTLPSSVNNLVVGCSQLDVIKLNGTHEPRMNLSGSSAATCSLV